MKLVERECGAVIPHIHGKPVLSWRAKALALILFLVFLVTGIIVWHYVTKPEEPVRPFESYEYKPIILDH